MNFRLTLSMAMATGLAVANIYYNQPLLVLMEKDLPGPWTSWVPTATQLGYALGLLLLVPLGDLLERRRLIVVQFGFLSLALVGAAASSSSLGLVACSFLVGVTATVAQNIVPFAAHLSPPEKRGATVGNVMAGLLCGILLSRALAGFVGSIWGWRSMFWASAPIALLTGAWMGLLLPRSRGQTGLKYPQLMLSLARLWRDLPSLRRSVYIQGALFASFSAFWTTLAFRLQDPLFGMGPGVAGLFGILGAAGVLAAPFAGRAADKRGPQVVILTGTLITLSSWIVFAAIPSLTGLVIGVILLDFGVQCALSGNQYVIYSLRPEARNRINTIFVGGMFLGGAAGSALGLKAWQMSGWSLVTLAGAVAAVLALLNSAVKRRD